MHRSTRKITQVPTIVPMCLYHRVNKSTNDYLSYIGNPTMVQDSDGVKFECIPHGVDSPYKGWTLKQRFYVVNPMFRPIPSYMSLMCAMQKDFFPFNTSEITQMYDPFDIQEKCINFITWMEPTPYTTPLYIYKVNEGSFVTFEEHKDWEHELMSPIYVLTTEPTEKTIFPDKHNWFNKVNGVPDFKFTQYMGRCTPNPEGIELIQCIIKNATGLVKPLSLLDQLEKIQHKEAVHTLPRLVQKRGLVFISVVLIIFLLSLFSVIWILTKTKKLNDTRKDKNELI